MSLLAALLVLPIAVRAEPFPGLEEPREVGCVVVREGLTLSGPAAFGGYSDIAFDAGTDRLTAVSDAGHVLQLEVSTDEDGDVVQVGSAETHPMTTADGETLGKRTGDAEGLAWLGVGYAVSFEGEDRLALLSPDGALDDAYPAAQEDLPILGANSGFEALTLLPNGELLAISEGKRDGLAIVRRGRLGTPMEGWAEARYRPAKDFAVTSARIEPVTGNLYVLERAFSPWRGARARIVRVASDRIEDEVIEGEQLARLGFLEGVDNMEGLDLYRSGDGALRIVLISDDNYSAAQRSVLMTLGLAPGCDVSADAAQAPARPDLAPQEPVRP